MHALDSVLGDVLSAPGARGAAVVDGVTGLTYAERGDCSAAGSGTEIRDLVESVADGLRSASSGEVESVAFTGTRTYHLVEVVRWHGDPVVLSVVLEREGTNVALATRHVAACAADLQA